jgi:hypothetical protein
VNVFPVWSVIVNYDTVLELENVYADYPVTVFS